MYRVKQTPAQSTTTVRLRPPVEQIQLLGRWISTAVVQPLFHHYVTQRHNHMHQLNSRCRSWTCRAWQTNLKKKKKNTLRWQNEGTSLNKMVLHCCTRSFSWQRLSSHIFLLKKGNLLCIRSRNQDDRGKCVSDFPALMLGYFILGPDFFFFFYSCCDFSLLILPFLHVSILSASIFLPCDKMLQENICISTSSCLQWDLSNTHHILSQWMALWWPCRKNKHTRISSKRTLLSQLNFRSGLCHVWIAPSSGRMPQSGHTLECIHLQRNTNRKSTTPSNKTNKQKGKKENPVISRMYAVLTFLWVESFGQTAYSFCTSLWLHR